MPTVSRRAVRRPPAPGWAGRVSLAPGLVLYVGPGGSADVHAHHAVQLVWAREGTLVLHREGQRARVRAALVPAGQPHALEVEGGPLALLLVERHGPRGAALDALARAAPGAELAGRLTGVAFPEAGHAPGPACDALLAALGVAPGAPSLSRATRAAVAYVEGALDGVPSLAAAAARAGLSPTRLTHRFSAEVGVPFRRFVLWARLARAAEAARAGASLTDAAHAAGFSDGAHLSRTFRAHFGLSPSAVLPHVELFGSPWA